MKKLSFILLIISALAVQCGNPQPVNSGGGETPVPENTTVNTPTKKPIDDTEYRIERPKPASVESEKKVTDAVPEGRVATKETVNSTQTYEGGFSYYADAALFKICGEARQYAIKNNAIYLEIERAYLSIEDRRIGEFIAVQVEGNFQELKGMEGGMQKTFVPTKFSGFERRKRCE